MMRSDDNDIEVYNENDLESRNSEVSEENQIRTEDSDDEHIDLDHICLDSEKFESLKARSKSILRYSKPLPSATLNQELAEVLKDFEEMIIVDRDNINVEMCRNRFTQQMTAKKLNIHIDTYGLPGHDARLGSSDHMKGYEFFLNLKNKTLLYTETSKHAAT